MRNIRNFCIIAHIDHGKSTLADRLLEYTKTISEREMQDQALDNMDLERERGITIKSHAIQMRYTHPADGQEYIFNLIDTPGHVDFSYEVSRAIAACEGALLLVDATQGIQAQTISNLYMAIDHDLEVIPIVNKVDVEIADIEGTKDQIVELLGCKREDIICASGRTGQGIEEIMAAIVHRIPPPKGDPDAPLQAMIFDSMYNSYRGVITYVRVMNGTLRKGDKIRFMATGKEVFAEEVGILRMGLQEMPEIAAGNVGYIITGIKTSREIKVGDTVTHVARPCSAPVKGFEEVKPMVFAGVFPLDNNDFEALRDSLEKLQLNDASLVFEPITLAALGFGFRCGFLGMLHMEIVKERLQREFNQDIITTVPNVPYFATDIKGRRFEVRQPSELPEPTHLKSIEEPYIYAQVITKPEYIGNIMSLCMDKRGVLQRQNYLTPTRVELIFHMPLAEIVFDFYDKLKSMTRGYASFDYHFLEYRETDVVKLEIRLNGDVVDAFSSLVHRSKAETLGRHMCERLKELIPRQQFQIPIQACIGQKVIARETISALRKDVTAKCYGGDITRKRKLLERQKEGKKRMRQFGTVEVPQEAFLKVLQLNNG
ncbi:MAG: translation elongation factor 4 [Saprospiraceae bacterium]|nr:translation elongation factor 4 [Saprospiraceae bacterium]MDW8484610.1 translation elongation factor 4 [Saprospiraceae bacterium]